MKFIQTASGWSAHETPFSFTLDDMGENLCLVIWHYAGKSGEQITRDLSEAVSWCHRFALEQTLAQLQRIAQKGARTADTDEGWQFVCNGSVPDMGYQCYLRPGHEGQCYYPVKGVWFNRE